MCGIAGILSTRRIDESVIRRMADTIRHRGPDDEGLWLDQEAGIGLGHRRLSIVDLTPSGHQPMVSANGRYVLSYNGEIYNHVALRREVEDAGGGPGPGGWRGHSDTETLVEAIALWGLEAALQKSVGMFALALWDRTDRRLQLARDRFGEKPLYYGWVGGDFVFASELKAVRAHPAFRNGIDRNALRLLLSRSYIPAPLSIFQGIYKLEPACILDTFLAVCGQPPARAPSARQSADHVRIAPYWSYRDVVVRGLASPIEDERVALEQLEATLAVAIEGQSAADVPVGAFLSGGIDSSTVVGLYSKYSPRRIRTFSIGFEEAAFNEAGYAKEVARHFGTDHNERYVRVAEAQAVIPLLPAMYDEPFGDSSQIPTHLVSRFAREQVIVALSGDGGDELFGGYNRYILADVLWRRMRALPAPVRASIGGAFGLVPPAGWDRLARLLPGGPHQPHFGAKVHKIFRTMRGAEGIDDIFNTFLDEWAGEGSPVLMDGARGDPYPFDLDLGRAASDQVRMMYCDAVAYLPDDILCKVDRASMAVSLESRVPFLDHRVAELAARFPASMKFRGGKGKHILRRLLYAQAPEKLFDRPKAGFGIPVGEWMRGPLRPWAEELLDTARLRREGYFDAAKVEKRWRQHLRGERDSTPALWTILMFQAWNAEGRPPQPVVDREA